jgi:hypothetical protein
MVMKQRFGVFVAACAGAAIMFAGTGTARAQVTVAAGYTPPDDTPSVNVGGTIFADYTYVQEPTVTDSQGNKDHANAFNVTRAYINVTGQINHLIQFRITPDVVRVGQVDGKDVPGITGTLTYRLKYAYGQLNFSDFTTKGSWFRLGLQQTPYVDFEESVYRYRFAGPIFVDRETFLTSSDLGATVHWNIPENYGDIHGGVYNGDGYTRPQDRDSQLSYQIRGTLRPLPQVAVLKGLRLTGFYDSDHFLRDAKKERAIFLATFENPCINFGFQYNANKDQTAAGATIVESRGYSVWATPRTTMGLEALIRWDRLSPDQTKLGRKQRWIVGPAYWFPVTKSGIASAVMFKFEQTRYMGAPNSKPVEESYGLFTLFNF